MWKIKEQLKEFYDLQADKFSKTRRKLWPEFFYIAEEIEKKLSNQEKVSILELGCWDGRLYRFLQDKFPWRINYVWVDLSENLIKIAKENLELRTESWEDVSFLNTDMLSYLENEDSLRYDFVIWVASFQHIPYNWERLLILKHSYRVLKYSWKIILFNWSFSKWFFSSNITTTVWPRYHLLNGAINVEWSFKRYRNYWWLTMSLHCTSEGRLSFAAVFCRNWISW